MENQKQTKGQSKKKQYEEMKYISSKNKMNKFKKQTGGTRGRRKYKKQGTIKKIKDKKRRTLKYQKIRKDAATGIGRLPGPTRKPTCAIG